MKNRRTVTITTQRDTYRTIQDISFLLDITIIDIFKSALEEEIRNLKCDYPKLSEALEEMQDYRDGKEAEKPKKLT